MKRASASLLAGLLFGLGLVISRMIDPAKVLAFLDIAGSWDPEPRLRDDRRDRGCRDRVSRYPRAPCPRA
jgi:uncharacterized membrane protein YedE/YeeE